MKIRSMLPAISLALWAVCPAGGQGLMDRQWLDRVLDDEYPALQKLYQDLHGRPELSGREARTAATVADQLSALAMPVTMNIGGHGVVGVLSNSPGPVLLVRTDLDGLPVLEFTGSN